MKYITNNGETCISHIENFTFDNIVELYKQYFISKRKNLNKFYGRMNKPIITNKEILDRNIFILKSKILFDKSDREIADRYNLCYLTINNLYKQVLKDIKNIIQKQ
jgi:hypothetical protein